MPTWDDIFAAGHDASSHPKLRFWKERKENPDVSNVRCEVYRPRDVLGYRPAKLYVHFYGRDNAELLCDEVEWDDELNTGLVALRVKAIDLDNEGQRFSLSLRAALRAAERRFGDGFFNAVFVEWVKETSFAETDPVREILSDVHTNNPYRGDGGSYGYCRELVGSAIRARATDLTEELNYPRADAENVLSKALAQYLDERFSVSVGRALGWK